MFLNSIINYCNSLQTQTKVAIAGASAVFGAAFVYFYFAKRAENADAETETDSRAEQSTEVLAFDKAEDSLRVQDKNNASADIDGRKNSNEAVSAEIPSRQQKRSELVIQVKELAYTEFNSQQQVN